MSNRQERRWSKAISRRRLATRLAATTRPPEGYALWVDTMDFGTTLVITMRQNATGRLLSIRRPDDGRWKDPGQLVADMVRRVHLVLVRREENRNG